MQAGFIQFGYSIGSKPRVGCYTMAKMQKQYPNRIRHYRELLGMALEDVAKLAGTTAQQIQKLETGERRLTDVWMYRLAPILRCKPCDFLLGGDASALEEGIDGDLLTKCGKATESLWREKAPKTKFEPETFYRLAAETYEYALDYSRKNRVEIDDKVIELSAYKALLEYGLAAK